MQLEQPQLFIKKLAILFAITIALVPLIHYRLAMPTYLFVGTLLVLHIYIFFIYLSRINWRKLRENRVGFVVRLSAIAMFSFILTLLHYQGPTLFVILSVGAAVTVHALILLLLMITRVPRARTIT